MRTRILSVFLCLVLVFALFPASAHAETPSAVQAGDILYFGEYDQIPVSWLILDAASTNIGTKGMFLLSEYVLDNGKVVYSREGSKLWAGSTGQEWCQGFLEATFSPEELALIPAVTKAEEPIQLFNLSWAETAIENEQVFFLSVQEVADYFDPDDRNSGLSTTALSPGAPYWWLRTPHAIHPDYAGIVYDANMVHDQMVYSSMGARPAINLSTDDILLFIPAEDVKNVGTVGPIEANDAHEWKLILKDSSRSFSIGATEVSGNTLSVSYANAPVGQNDYISLLVCDAQDKVTAYGKLLKPSDASGTLSIDLSSFAIPEGGSLYLFSEQDNRAQHTNFASALCRVGSELRFDSGRGSGVMEPVVFTPGQTAVLPDSTFTPPDYEAFDHWELDGVPVDSGTRFPGDTTLTAVYSRVPVTGMFFARSSYELIPSDRVEIKASFEPDGAIDMDLDWESSNTQVVSILNNRDGSCTITARRGGVAVITATSATYGVSASTTVNVLETNESHVTPLMLGLGALALLLIAAVILVLVRRRR